jgi:hypothetical protein
MRKLTILIIIIVLAINSQGQNVDSVIGKYSVTDIWSQISVGTIIHTDTAFYTINISNYTDNEIYILNFAPFDTIKATIFSDSIKFSQTLYYDEWNNYMISGSGRFYADTINYQYKCGSTRGLFIGSCIAIKVKENSINNLIGKKKNVINLYSIGNGLLQLQTNKNISGEIILYTTDGKKVLKEPVKEMESTVCAPTSGLLLYRFVTEKGEVQAGKVVVR